MELNQGLWLDSSETNQPKGTWRYLLNGVFDVDKDVITDEDGFRKFSKNLPSKDLIGSVTIDDEIVLFLTDSASSHEIGVLNKNGLYDKIVGSSLFNFDKNFPIKAKHLKNFNRERIVTFVDEHNTPKIVNIDSLLYTLNSSREITGTSDLNNYLLFPEWTEARITQPDVVKNGSVLSGTYYISLQYENEYGVTGGWSNQSCPFHISGSTSGEEYGSDSNVSTSRSIQFTLEDVDTRFSKINIALISEIEGNISAVLSRTVNITGSTISNINITNNDGTVLALEEVLVNKTNYLRIKDIEITEEEFLGANVTEEEEIDFQQYANMIQINYVSTDRKIRPEDNDGAQHVGTDKGFRTGEVYSFYCSLVLKKGGESRLFHIPGRAPVGTEATDISRYVTGGAGDKDLPTGTKKFRVEDTSNNGSGTTNMGYWENEDETYPNTDEYNSSGVGGLDLRGEKVRHHRFPSLRKLHSLDGTPATFAVNRMPVLSIDVDNIIISAEIAEKIVGVKIYYAKRDIENMTCIGQSLYQLSGVIEYFGSAGDDFRLKPTIGNFRLTDVSAEDTYTLAYTPSVIRLRFYDFALMNSKASITPSYSTNQVIYQLDVDTEPYTSDTTNTAYADASDTANEEFRRLFFNYAGDPTATKKPIASVATDAQYLDKVIDYNYVPNNVIINDIDNSAGEEHIDIALNERTTDFPLFQTDIFEPSSSNWGENTSLTDLNQLKNNVYFGINKDRDVVSCHDFTNGQYIKVTAAGGYSNKPFKNGDNFVDTHTAIRHGLVSPSKETVIDPNDPLAYRGFGAIGIKTFPHESIQNVRFRYDSKQTNSSYYPNTKTSTRNIIKNFLIFESTPITYTNDFNQLNDNDATIIFDLEDEVTSKHPFRVIRSNKIGREDEDLVLNFPPLSYYEMPKKRGEIVGINAIRDKVVIRHEEGTYITRPKQKITTDAGDATIGDNDLFDIEPQELFTTDQGFIKSQGVFDAISTENGLILIDRQEGRIFTIGQGAIELTTSESGVKTFFLEEFINMEDDEVVIDYTSVNSVVEHYDASNRLRIKIPLSTYTDITVNDFKKGEFIWFNFFSVFAKILRVYSETGFVVLETNATNGSHTDQGLKHYRKVNSPFYNNGVILGWDKDRNTLFVTKKCTNCLSKENEERYVGRLTGTSSSFTDELETGDIVRVDGGYSSWTGSIFTPVSTEDRSFTISFNFNKKRWVSFHSYKPVTYLYQNDRILSFDSVVQEVFKHHQKNRKGKYYDEMNKTFQIDIIFNEGERVSKKFTHLSWVVNFLSSLGVVDDTKTFETIQCSNSYDDLGESSLVPYVNISSRGNVRNISGTWNFNTLKNSDNESITDKYLLVVFKDSDENSLYLYDVSSSFKIVDKK